MNAGKDGMKVLWLTNILFPEPCRMLGLPEPVLGGWMYAGAQELMKAVPDLKLAAPCFIRERAEASGRRVHDLLSDSAPADMNAYRKELEPFFREARYAFGPDVVHIHGSNIRTPWPG